MCFRPAGAGRAPQCPQCGAFNRPDVLVCQKCGYAGDDMAPNDAAAPEPMAPSGSAPKAPSGPGPKAPGAPKPPGGPKAPGNAPQ